MAAGGAPSTAAEADVDKVPVTSLSRVLEAEADKEPLAAVGETVDNTDFFSSDASIAYKIKRWTVTYVVYT